jgi:phosphate transport system ATP-binding protein
MNAPMQPIETYSAPVAQDQIKLETKNLDFFYGKGQALFGVSLPAIKNGVTALIGPSGCGP